MKKTLIALSLFTAFAVNAQTNPNGTARPDATASNPVTAPASNSAMGTRADVRTNGKMTDGKMENKVPDTTSLNKKVVKEGEKTHEALKDGKITSGQAAALDKHEANIARDISAAKADGKVSGNEKSIIKKEVDINEDLRDEMKDKTKKNQKDMDKATK